MKEDLIGLGNDSIKKEMSDSLFLAAVDEDKMPYLKMSN